MDNQHKQYSMFKHAGLGWPTGMIEVVIVDSNDGDVTLQVDGRRNDYFQIILS